MTVAELIAKLGQYDQNATVAIADADTSWDLTKINVGLKTDLFAHESEQGRVYIWADYSEKD